MREETERDGDREGKPAEGERCVSGREQICVQSKCPGHLGPFVCHVLSPPSLLE